MRFYLFILLISYLSLYANEAKLENVSVQLKWFYQYQFAGILVAKEKGFYEDAGLDVTIKERDPTKNNILQVVNGESEYGIADSVILRYRAEGHPVKIISTIFQHNAMVLISKKGSGIVSPYEMKGKSISFQEGLDDSIITSLLSFANLEKSDYIKKPMDFTHMDFVNGSTEISEAYISIEPYWLKKKYNIDVNIIDPKNYGIDFYGDLIFTTQKEIDAHPKRVKAFKEATLKGWMYALKHTDETIDIILNNYNTRDLTKEQLLYEARITENLIATKHIPLGDTRKERFKTLSDLYDNKSLSKKSLDNAVETIIYSPDAKSNLFEKYIYPILIFIIILIILVMLLFLYSRHLKYLVSLRTKELELSKHKAVQAGIAKDEFLANMSHEIRTPLNAILGFVTILKKQTTEEKPLSYLNIIDSSGHSLLTIINDILDFSKIQSGKFKISPYEVDIIEEMSNAALLFASKAYERNLIYDVYIDVNMPQKIMIDAVRVKQIFSNLLSNAIKFTGKDKSIKVKVVIENELLIISVEDTGIGISKENISKVFSAFEQSDGSTTRKYGGTGLGLSISRRLSELMNGTLSVSSKEGVGSTFKLSLPVEVVDESSKERISSEQLHSLTIALLDTYEDSIKLKLIRKYLSDLGAVNILELDTFQEDGYDLLFFIPNYEYNEDIINNNKPSIALLRNSAVSIANFKHIRSLYAPYTPNDIILSINESGVIKQNKETLSKQLPFHQDEETNFNGYILVAEDNKTNQMLISLLLEDFDLKFKIANDGLEAVSMFKEEKFDLVLMDENMPELNGIEAMKLIREYQKEKDILKTPIIALTASVLETDKEKFTNAGMDGFVGKPIDTAQLESELARFLDRKVV